MKRTSLIIFALIMVAGLIPVLAYTLEGWSDTQTIDTASLPLRNLPPFEQAAQAFAGLVVKPAYMMLCVVIILALLGQKTADLAALRWGQIAFLAGETFCALNFYVYKHESVLSEYLHSYGMVLSFGFTAFAVLEGLDSRILKLTSSKSACEALRVCGGCTRYAEEGCKARVIARFILPILAVLTFIPILSPLQPDVYAVAIFNFPYSYTRLNIYEIYERRVLPALALIAFFIAYLSLWRKGEPPIPFITKIFACAGLGALGLSFFRLTLNAIFVDNLVWFEFWEEATELMFVGAIAFALWQFKATLLRETLILEALGINRK